MTRAETKKLKRNLIVRLVMIIIAGTILVLFAVSTLAWFSSNKKTTETGLKTATVADTFIIAVERTSRYDSGYDYITGTDELKDHLSAAGYDLTHSVSSESPKFAFELVNEYQYETKYYLMPGSYGTLTLYLKPKDGVDNVTVDLSLQVGAYISGLDENDDPTFDEVDDVTVLNMLKGHILFFGSRTGATYENYQYGDFVQSGVYTYDTSTHVKCSDVGKTDYYKVVLYWEWPLTYYDIVDNMSTTSPAVTRKYPAAVGTYLASHRNYFFATNVNSNDTEELSDGYNDGDQTIGDGVSCVVVYITADVHRT